MIVVFLLSFAVAVNPPPGLRGPGARHESPWRPGHGAPREPSRSTEDASQAGPVGVPPVAPPPAAAVRPEPSFQLDWGIERQRDRIRYRFENPSTFDTTELVDHFFQQRYAADHTWVVARAAYRPSAARRWVAEAGLAPPVTAFGEDLDTFFNPGNNVIVSGTSGEVRMRSARAAGWFERTGRRGRVARLGYSYRRDVSIFRTPERKIVTMSNPPSTEESITFDHETTISQVHQFWVGWTTRRSLPRRWRVDLDANAAPATLARLNTLLPEKYPDRDIVFWASGFELAGRVMLARGGRWPVELSANIGRAFPYVPRARFVRTSLGVSATVGFAR